MDSYQKLKVDANQPHSEFDRDIIEQSNHNWYEVRLVGKVPERRGYHSSFAYNNK